jgi:rhamnan synthesis protein F
MSKNDSTKQGQVNITEAELVALRSAVEDARSEARVATIAARAAEKARAHLELVAKKSVEHAARKAKALEDIKKVVARERAATAEAKKLAKKWQKQCDEITSSRAWKIAVRLSQSISFIPFGGLRRQPPGTVVDREKQRSSKGTGPNHPVTVAAQTPRTSKSNKKDKLAKYRDPTVLKAKTPKGRSLKEKTPRASPSSGLSLETDLPTDLPSGLRSLSDIIPSGRVAIVLHLYYSELWPEFRDAIRVIPETADLFVTLTRERSESAADWIRAEFPKSHIITLNNRGRDILPFVTILNTGVLFRYEFFCKLHTKRSLYREDGNYWRQNLVQGILDAKAVTRILSAFDADPRLGIVVADGFAESREQRWLANLPLVNQLCTRGNIRPLPANGDWPVFPAGSIYWGRTSFLEPLARLNLAPSEFEPEPLPSKALPHAIERLIGHLCREAGLHVATTRDLAYA